MNNMLSSFTLRTFKKAILVLIIQIDQMLDVKRVKDRQSGVTRDLFKWKNVKSEEKHIKIGWKEEYWLTSEIQKRVGIHLHLTKIIIFHLLDRSSLS